jgi:AraC-like DNA-binding protein
MGPSTLSSWALLVAEALAKRGIDSAEMFRRAGLSIDDVQDPNSRCPASAMQRLWTLAADATQDPCFGLEVGRAWHPTAFHALGYSALAAGSLREALAYLARYSRVVSTGARVDVIEDGAEVSIRLMNRLQEQSPSARWTQAPVQAGLAALLVLCRAARGEFLDPLRVTFVHEDNGARAGLQSFFNCAIVFQAEHDAIAFSAHDIAAPLRTANPTLLRINEHALASYAAALQTGDIAERVRAELIRVLPSGEVDQAAIARSLHVSLRSMQRKLKEQGVTFRELLDETRKQLAERYARDSSLSASEVAYLLGFSEQSSLSRATRRWKQRAGDALKP